MTSRVSGTPYATPRAGGSLRRRAPEIEPYSQRGVPKRGSLHFLPEPQSESRLQTHLPSLHLALLHWASFVQEAPKVPTARGDIRRGIEGFLSRRK